MKTSAPPLAATALIVLLMGSTWSYVSRAPLLRVEETDVIFQEGTHLKKQEVLNTIGDELDQNILRIRPGELTRRISNHPWVRSTLVVRHFPDSLLIEIEERTPVALLALGTPILIDRFGHPIAPPAKIDSGRLTVIRGGWDPQKGPEPEDAWDRLQKALDLLRLLGAEGAGLEISELVMDDEAGITMRLGGEGALVAFGLDGYGRKAERLRQILADCKARDIAPESIDLDYRNRAFVRFEPGRVPSTAS